MYCFNLFVFANVLPDEIKEISKRYNLALVQVARESQTNNLYKGFGIKDTGYYLIRPDMHIGFINDKVDMVLMDNYLRNIVGFMVHS